MILSLTGPSGVGKTTLLHNVVQRLPEARPLMSYTTRAPRPSDEPGEYSYISAEEFETFADNGAFAWEAKTTANRYGTRTSDVSDALQHGVYIPILVLDAAKKLCWYAQQAGRPGAVKYIYIEIDDEQELRKRLSQRHESPGELEGRITQCRSWNREARASGIPFLYIDGMLSREEMLTEALAYL